MKVTITRYQPPKPVPLEAFANEYNLHMEVKERDPKYIGNDKNMRFYASFRDVECVQGALLVLVHGDGATPYEAILDYMTLIQGQTIRIMRTVLGYDEAQVPNVLVYEPDIIPE